MSNAKDKWQIRWHTTSCRTSPIQYPTIQHQTRLDHGDFVHFLTAPKVAQPMHVCLWSLLLVQEKRCASLHAIDTFSSYLEPWQRISRLLTYGDSGTKMLHSSRSYIQLHSFVSWTHVACWFVKNTQILCKLKTYYSNLERLNLTWYWASWAMSRSATMSTTSTNDNHRDTFMINLDEKWVSNTCVIDVSGSFGNRCKQILISHLPFEIIKPYIQNKCSL